ncbi:MAG TPA: hypothetical protein EYH34_12885 [Planctomycetes bacterium]|nr:hypothetical protein [Planctomycetota bacterium]
MDYWAWAVLLIFVGVGLAGLEVFIPSGGALGFLAICAVVAAVIVGFLQGPGVGMAVLLVAVIGIPVVVVLALKFWPRTPIGRRVLLGPQRQVDVLPDDPRRESLKQLEGRIARAKTKMLPSGLVVVDGRKVDAVSEGMPIEPGQKVRIVRVRGNSVIVRPVPEDTPEGPEDEALSRPVDTVVPDPFDEPPA